jgi:hypothetical protein
MNRLLGMSTLAGVATFLTSTAGSCFAKAGAFLAAAIASSISAAIILLLGPVPTILYRFIPFSSANFLARGLINFLSPVAAWVTPLVGAELEDTSAFTCAGAA